MSLLDKFDQNRLSALPDQIRDRLNQLEELIKEYMDKNGGDFDECVKIFGPQLADLANRLAGKISTLSIRSVQEAMDVIKFALNVGYEVYQIVENVKDCVFSTPLSGEAAKQRQIEFGKDLAYFVWLTVNPFGGKLSWVPFKKTIEKFLVKWIAGMAIELAFNVIEKNGTLSGPLPKKSKLHVYIKAI